MVTNINFLPAIFILLPRDKVMRIYEMITKEEMLWSDNKFSQLIVEGNVWRSVWRICMWILGLKGLIQTLSMGLSKSILIISWVRLYVGFEDTHSRKIGQNVQILRYMADIILGSLQKHPFLLALHRWRRFARRNICDSVTEIPYWWRKICPQSGQKRWLVDGVVTLL